MEMNNNQEFEALCARLLPKFNEYLLRRSKNVFACEMATSLEGISSMPALYSKDGVQKQVIAPLSLIVAGVESEVDEHEAARVEAENARVAAEKSRVSAETKRESDFATSKKAADDATSKALATYSHPPYVDADGYYYRWNVSTSSYNKTDVNLTGKAFQIKKVFASVSAMNTAGAASFDENDFILINTANVEDEDNAKLYVVMKNTQGTKVFSYLVDMSGFRGFTGKTPQLLIGTVTTLASGSKASAAVVASGTDSNGNPQYKINLSIPKGDKITLADLTDAEIAQLQKPATDAIAKCDAATAAANTATSNAKAATTAANNAATAATKTASDAAASAKKTAEDAAANATAKANAADALNTKVSQAETARAAAETARVEAETARANAETTRADDEQTRKDDENTRIANETARGKAESSRAQAESGRVSAETSRVKAENGRASAESSRAQAESSRVTAEKSRASAESSRATAESSRVSVEKARVTAETNRASAESDRVKAEDSRKEAESSRVQAETDRAAAESNRATAEANRASAESSRVTAEKSRASAESSRAQAESSRASVEKSRVTAETARASAESARAKAETSRQSGFQTALDNVNTAIATANDTATHPTKVGTDNYVYIWDKDNQSYTKTAIYVKGDKGDKGEKGDQGIQGVQGEKGKSPTIKNGNWWLYDETKAAYVDSGISVSSDYVLTKANVESVLTGNITTHSHDKYALGTSLADEVSRATQAEAAIRSVVDVINGASTVEGSFRKAIADLIGGAPEALDTLKEISDKLAADDDLHNTIEAAIALKADQTAVDAVVKRLAAVEGGSATTVEVTGTGNAITSISKSGTKITATKGSSFLTSHQSLAGYATEQWVQGRGYLTAHQSIYALTIQKNGSSVGTYTPNSKAQTLNITVPTKVSELSNDRGYLTAHQDISGKANKATTLAGYGITDAKIENGKITLGSASITPLTAHQSLSAYLKSTDISDWAKATSKPSYSWSEIGSKPSTFAPSAHNHSAGDITSGTLPVARGGTGQTTLTDAINVLINGLAQAGNGTPTDADYYVSQYIGGGTTNTTYTRRPMSSLYNYVKGKLDSVYQPKGNYLTAHQSLANYYTKTECSNTFATKSVATTSANGLMSSTDKKKLDGISGSIPTKTSQLTNDSGYITKDDLKETITIQLTSNQSTADASLKGVTITVKNGSSTLGTYTWQGTAITMKVAGAMSVTVSVSGVTGYRTPSAQTFTTVVGNSRTVTMRYDTEVVTVTVKASNGASLNGQTITVNGTAHTWQGTAFSQKIPFGTAYTVTANAKSLYSTPATQSYTAGQATRSVTLTYTYAPLGIYILDTDGNLTTTANWNTANNAKAVGVFVGTEKARFVIHKNGQTQMPWSSQSNFVQISGITTTTSSSDAKLDFAGSANTDKIVAQDSQAQAALYCQGQTINGKKCYLWSLGEACEAYNNKSAIDAALSKIGGTAMSNSYLWTSTQYYAEAAWRLDWENGYVRGYAKTNGYDVRAVCAF